MKRWPEKSKQQRRQEAELAERQLEALMSSLSDEALELLDAFLTLEVAWDDPLYAPLVDRVEAELSNAALPDSNEPVRPLRRRPRLPSRFTHNVSRAEKDQARRVLNRALGIEEPAPVRPRLRVASQAPTMVAGGHRRFLAANPRPRLRKQRERLKTPPLSQPTKVDTDPDKNPWLYEEGLWE